MADISLQPVGVAEWFHAGSKVRHIEVIGALNCRSEKEVYDQIVTLIQSNCQSTDTCPPFIKSYHDFAITVELFEFITGVGLGCLMEQGSLKYRRRSKLSDAGNYTSGAVAITNLQSAAERFLSTNSAAWAVSNGNYFGAKAQSDLQCPDSTDGLR